VREGLRLYRRERGGWEKGLWLLVWLVLCVRGGGAVACRYVLPKGMMQEAMHICFGVVQCTIVRCVIVFVSSCDGLKMPQSWKRLLVFVIMLCITLA